jgi:hypothetical protein
MPAFLHSCRFNPDIDWLIFCNAAAPAELPANVRLVPLSLDAFCQRAAAVLGIPVRIRSDFAYKIADFKSAYGEIFAEELCDYAFWGHCDLDLVWGRIRARVTEDILNSFDIITSRPLRISGHFCLFRNLPEINQTFRWIPRWQQMMLREAICAIDERHITDYLHVHSKPNWIVRLKQRIMGKQAVQPRVYWEQHWTTSGAHQRTMPKGSGRQWIWEQGRAFDADGEEKMYLHFHLLKASMRSIDFMYGNAPDRFVIDATGIYARPQ